MTLIPQTSPMTAQDYKRRYALAMMLKGQEDAPIDHWAQGLGRMAQSALGGYGMYQADQKDRTDISDKAKAYGVALSEFGGPSASPAATGMAPPSAPPTNVAPVDMPSGGVYSQDQKNPIDLASDKELPRGIRNNNPLNIEAGDFTKSRPGYVGSDGRFAIFDSPQAGTGAASTLLDTYQKKYGINSVAGVLNRWAPSSDGNNVPAYAANVSKQLGIDPNAPIPPEMRPQLIAAMGQHENGRPIDPGQQPYQVAGPPTAAPQASAPQATAQALAPQAVDPEMAKIARMLDPSQPQAVQQLGMGLADAYMAKRSAPTQYGFTTLPDGTVMRQDPRKGTVEPIYQSTPKAEFGVVSKDENGKEVYGWKDPVKRSVTEYQSPNAGTASGTIPGPDGKPIAIPPGVDRKTFVTEVTRANADAATGKKTEVQGNAEQFANRMEKAEADFAKVKDAGSGKLAAAQHIAGSVPVIGSGLQSSDYQKFAQAKSQFITALLRKESGAAISKDEFTRYDKEFFPQPLDGPEVVAQKEASRRVAMDAMRKNAGPGYKPANVAPSAPVTKSIGGKEYYQENGQWYEK